MLDLILRGGTVVDGTGAAAQAADIGIRDGRIVAIGVIDEDATRVVDVSGRVVAPGFVDIHTHYDAQVLWDGTASPSPLHGVTTVVGGNCGFSIAPLGPGGADYVMRMMAVVEGIPIETLRAGPAWDWATFGEFLDRVEPLAINAGFLVGHSTLRRAVMGEDAVSREATPDELDQMVTMLGDALAAGALGFSSSLDEVHTDGDHAPVPSRAAAAEEFVALAGALRDHPGTVLEFIPAVGEIPADRMELMADMSLAANRPLNWNLLGSLSPVEIYEQQLVASDVAAARGAHVVALTLPDLMRLRANRMIEDLPGFRDLRKLPDDERLAALADPGTRANLRASIEKAAAKGLGAIGKWDLVEIAESRSPESELLVGMTIAAAAAHLGVDPVDLLLDVVVPERLPLTMVLPSLVPSLGASDAGWEARVAVWQDERVVLGGSDAGAHLDLMCHANYTTRVLGEAVRQRELIPIEAAVRLLTDVPARLYGLTERGRITEGWHADLVVFDPATIGSGPALARFDLPADGERLYAEALGIDTVFVAGREVVSGGAFTGTRAGSLLRSGTDTETVSVPGGARA